MKFMILVKSNPELEQRLAATSASEMKEQMAAMARFNDGTSAGSAVATCALNSAFASGSTFAGKRYVPIFSSAAFSN